MATYAYTHPTTALERVFPIARPEPDAPWLEVRQYWGDVCLDTAHFRPGKPVTIGDGIGHRWSFLGVDLGWVSPGAAKVLPWLPPVWSEVTPMMRADLHTPSTDDGELATWDGERWILRAPGTVRAVVDGVLHGEETLRSEGIAEQDGQEIVLPVDPGAVIEVRLGELDMLVRVVPRAEALERGAVEVDGPFGALLSTFSAAAVLLGMLVWLAPAPATTALLEIDPHVVHLALAVPPKKTVEPTPEKTANPDAKDKAAEAEPTEGKTGKGPKDRKADRKMAKRMRDKEIVENAGLIGAMRDVGLEALLGSGSLGDELVGAAAGLVMAKGGGGPGGFGLGERGLGRGGSIEGIGDVWGAGGGPGGREGYGPSGKKGDGPQIASTADTMVLGSLDRAVVDEVVKRHLAAIRYCYQRELQREPELSGKLVVKFVIAGDGSVSSSKLGSSTMGHAGVERCVTGRFLKMQFPEPNGNGIVIVSYPFLLSPG
ncbi:MAG: outer membrane biosynthesis protein TonB [Myxococcota bacterium]|jgi:hypothetical protein